LLLLSTPCFDENEKLSYLTKIRFSSGHLIYYLFCGAFFVMPMGTSPFTILGGCILTIWLFSGEFIRRKEGYLKEAWLYPVLAIIVLTWLGLIWSPDPSDLGLKYAKKTHYWLYALALAGTGFNKDPSENLIKAFLVGLLFNALVAYLQVGNIVPRFSEWGSTGYTGFYGGYNTLAILLVLGMMTASFYFRVAVSKRERIIYASLMLVYFIHLMILEGRGGYLTFALLSPIIIYNLLYGKKLYHIFLVYALIIGIMSASPIVRDRVSNVVNDLHLHLKEGGDVKMGKTYSKHIDRIYMWRWAIALFIKHPLIGVGTGGYKKTILMEGGDKGISHPHNNILHMAASFGILGLFVFGWLFWILLKAGWQHRHSLTGFFILASSLVILIGGLTDTHILDAGGLFLLALTTGLMSVLPKREPVGGIQGLYP